MAKSVSFYSIPTPRFKEKKRCLILAAPAANLKS